MSKFKPNAEQLSFIETMDKNVLVSASAGSGKTTTMVEKIIRIVKNGISIDNLLIITYTVASANEMKQRIYRSLIEEIRNSENEDEVAYLSTQLEKLNNCDIGTIHSICKKIISKYFYVINQDVNFGIVEQSDYLFMTATNTVFKKFIVSDNEDFFQLYESYNKKRNDKTLTEIVKTLHYFFSSKVDALAWKKHVLEKCYDSNVKTNICVNYILDKCKRIASQLVEEFSSLLNFDGDEKYIKVVNNRLQFLNCVIGAKDYIHFLKVINDCSLLTKASTNKLGPEYDVWVQNYERANNNFKVFKEEMVGLEPLVWNEESVLKVKNLLSTLFSVVDEVENEYYRLKKDKNLLDFSDLEHKTLEILNSGAHVCEEVSQKYEYIFVDEYQDINELQEEIINKIKRENNLNLIGDVKQSIFAFRLATPAIFIDKYNNYPKNDNSCVVKFNQNFRSKNNILQFVNWVCNEVITEKTVGIDYKKDAQLIFPEVKGEDSDKVVEISILNKCNDEDDLDKDEKEALLVVRKIKDILQKTYQTSNGEKHYSYKDIAIISRSKTSLISKIISALKTYNIPCNVKYRKDIFASNGVQTVYSFLKILHNSNDSLSLAILLKNIYGLNENQLAKIKMISNEDFAKCCKDYCENGDDENIRNVLDSLYKLLNESIFKISYMDLHNILKEFIDKIFIKYYSYIDGQDNISQIDEFLRLVDNNLYKHDINACINYLHDLEGSASEVGKNESSDAVTITTIHSSKGLEYKCVIFVGLGGNLGINKNSSDIVVSDKYGVGLQYLDVENRIKADTLIKQACLFANEHEQVNEELRLLYVALTRSMQYLILTGVYDVGKILNPSNKGIYSSRKYFDWIFKGLTSLDRSKFACMKNFYINENSDAVAKVEIDVLEDEKLECVDKIEFFNCDKNLLNKVSNNLRWRYPYMLENSLPLKNSVSSILKESKDYENSVDSFKELSLKEKVVPSEGIERGNAYHKVMQEVDFSRENNIDDILQHYDKSHLVNKNKIKICIDTIKSIASNTYVEKEKQFLMKVRHSEIVEGGNQQKILVQGVIDLFLIDDEGITLIDYKTNKINAVNDLAKMYATQMKLYSIALEKAYGKQVKNVYLYSFDKDCLVDMKNYIK